MNKILSDKTYVVLAILGSGITLFGQVVETPQFAFIVGSMLLFFTAIHFNLVFFIALELILVAGHAAILLGISPTLQLALPVLLSFQLLIYYCFLGQWNNIYLLIGILGIAILSTGFSYQNHWIFFFGGACIATYSYYCVYKGIQVCYIWAILNTIFALTSLYYIIFG